MVLAKYQVSPSLTIHWLTSQGSQPSFRSAGTDGKASSIIEVMTDWLYGNSANIRTDNETLFNASYAAFVLPSALYWSYAWRYRSAAAWKLSVANAFSACAKRLFPCEAGAGVCVEVHPAANVRASRMMTVTVRIRFMIAPFVNIHGRMAGDLILRSWRSVGNRESFSQLKKTSHPARTGMPSQFGMRKRMGIKSN